LRSIATSPLFRQFVSFSAIGAAAFVVDAAILTILVRTTGVGLYAGRAISFLCAATFTWSLNRIFTFPGAAYSSRIQQWMRFLGANAIGALANLGVYAWLVATFGFAARQPAYAVAAGSLSGLAFNFSLSKIFVFKSKPVDSPEACEYSERK
jgi:putative flippase GtrA